MERISKAIWIITLIVFALTSFLTLAGLVYVWFINRDASLPYLDMLFTSLIVEIIGVCVLVLKTSANFAPKTKTYKSKDEVNEFLKNFALSGSSVEFVSNRATWLTNDKSLQDSLIEKSLEGNYVSILTNYEPQNCENLKNSGVEFINNISASYTPNARFTLINSARQGAEEVAISVGNFPNHKVYTFNGQNSPYIIAMAKDIIALMKLIKEQNHEI